uniref:Evasin n=1 Tax=Rhipicephalus zambeziensis TaxID=60191 RepID=A0A224Y3F6_9ACAR
MCWYLFLLVGLAASQGHGRNSVSMDPNTPATNSSTQSTEKTPLSTNTMKATSTPSTTTTQGARPSNNRKYVVHKDRRGCLRKVLKSYNRMYPASCVVRCPYYDILIRDGKPCLKVIDNQLEERQSVQKLMCWKGYCSYGVCVTKHFSQRCEIPANSTVSRRPNDLAE